MNKIRDYINLVKKLIVLVNPLKIVMIMAIIFGSIGHIVATLIPAFGIYSLLNYKLGLISIEKIIIVFIVFTLSRSILRYLEQLCNHFVAFRVLEIIRDKIFRALRKLAPAKMEGVDTGKLVSIITSDIELLEVFYAHTISPVLIAFIHSLVFAILMWKINILYALVLIIFHFTMAIVVPIITSKRGKNIGDIQRQDVSNLNSSIMDTFYGIEESTQFFNGQNRKEEMMSLTKKLNKSSSILSKVYGENQSIANSVIMIGNITILLTAIYLYKNGQVNQMNVILPIIVFMSSFGPVSALSNLANNLLTTFACGERVIDILEEEPEVGKVVDGEDVDFENLDINSISFSYENEEVLKNLNLKVNKGEILGISGKSGCGKSTLLKLLMRFYDVESGSIRKSSVDIKDINTKNLRKKHCYITQSTHLFNESILENLKVANENANLEEIEEACKKASIHDFIVDLPEGYNTKIGNLDTLLSTGEKQRLAVARGFLQDGDLLLLDEPTSNIDSLNEGIVLKSLWEKSKDKTIIIVSHKMSTLRIAKRIENLKRVRKS
ncbi:MAG: ABC transporter ATP-binding protein [Peptoniphilaceae bacterium]